MCPCLEKKLKFDENGNGSKLVEIIFDHDCVNKVMKEFQNPRRRFFVEEALALLVDGNFMKFSYNLMRNTALNSNNDIYPAYAEGL